jgi:hypothetical protein
MTRRKLINRDELLKYKVGVRFDEKTYNKLKSWVEQTSTATVGELVRKIVTNEKVTFYTRDISMKEPTDELIRIRKEINAIGVNINQITEFFHTADSSQQKLFHALKVADTYQQVTDQVNLIWKHVREMSSQWSAR